MNPQQPQIKKNLSIEDRVFKLEKYIQDLEKQLAVKNYKLSQIIKDINDIKSVCNTIYRKARLPRTQNSNHSLPNQNVHAVKKSINIDSHGTQSSKG